MLQLDFIVACTKEKKSESCQLIKKAAAWSMACSGSISTCTALRRKQQRYVCNPVNKKAPTRVTQEEERLSIQCCYHRVMIHSVLIAAIGESKFSAVRLGESVIILILVGHLTA